MTIRIASAGEETVDEAVHELMGIFGPKQHENADLLCLDQVCA